MENFEVEYLRVYKPEHGEEPKPEAADIPRFWYCAPADILLDLLLGMILMVLIGLLNGPR